MRFSVDLFRSLNDNMLDKVDCSKMCLRNRRKKKKYHRKTNRDPLIYSEFKILIICKKGQIKTCLIINA